MGIDVKGSPQWLFQSCLCAAERDAPDNPPTFDLLTERFQLIPRTLQLRGGKLRR